MSKRILLSGYYGFENFGDDLILEVMLGMLQSFGVSPIVLSENPGATTRMYQVESIERANISRIWKTMRETSGFISGGGGLFQDVTGPGSTIYYGGLIEMAYWQKQPIAFFGQGIGPLRSGLGRLLTARAMRHADLVVVRDVKSQVWASKIAKVKARLMGDPVWLWKPSIAQAKGSSNKGLGVSVRPWPSLRDREIQAIAECIAGLPTIREVGVNLIDCQAGADILPLSKLEQYLKNAGIPYSWFTGANAIAGIAQSSALLGMRYHSILIAAQLGIPVVSLSYDPKVQILASQLKIVDFPIDSLLEAFTSDRFQASLRLADSDAVESFRQSAMEGFSMLKDWINAS